MLSTHKPRKRRPGRPKVYAARMSARMSALHAREFARWERENGGSSAVLAWLIDLGVAMSDGRIVVLVRK